MKKFYGTQEINAKPMNRLDYNLFRGWDLPSNENGADLGYLVEKEGDANTPEFDGYVQWLTKEQFEADYNKSGSMTFGEALIALKSGEKVSRTGWNGKGMFAYYVPANKYPMSGNTLETMKGFYPDDMVPYRHYLALKTAQDDIATWSPSTSDALAEDWGIVV